MNKTNVNDIGLTPPEMGERRRNPIPKIYDLGCDEMLRTIKKTWESDVFVKGEKNLGVIFNGLKGTGKTLSAKPPSTSSRHWSTR